MRPIQPLILKPPSTEMTPKVSIGEDAGRILTMEELKIFSLKTSLLDDSNV
jgi:hypothetical protein